MKDIMSKTVTKKSVLRTIVEFILLAVGAILAAFALETFLVPNLILDGGMTGIGIMINNLTGVPLGILTVILNIPFILLGFRKIGHMFVGKSIFAMVIFSVFLEIFKQLEEVTDEYLLAVCFGGVLFGLGVGLVIRCGGCLDGTESLAIVISKKFGLPVGRVVLIFNIVIFAVAGILFGFDRAMYSLLTYFITSKVLDIVESGPEKEKAAMIITDSCESVAEQIYKRLGRTCTIMEGEGLVSGKKSVMYCVVTTFEVYELKNILNELDESAFVTITDISEIIGNHVKSSKKIEKIKENLEDA